MESFTWGNFESRHPFPWSLSCRAHGYWLSHLEIWLSSSSRNSNFSKNRYTYKVSIGTNQNRKLTQLFLRKFYSRKNSFCLLVWCLRIWLCLPTWPTGTYLLNWKIPTKRRKMISFWHSNQQYSAINMRRTFCNLILSILNTNDVIPAHLRIVIN